MTNANMSEMDSMPGLTRTDSHRLNPVGLGIQTAPDGTENEIILDRVPCRPVVKLPVLKPLPRPPITTLRRVLDPIALKANERKNPHWRLAFAQDSKSIILLEARDCPNLADLAVAREQNWINETITALAREHWNWLSYMYHHVQPHERAVMDADKNSEWRKRIAITLEEFKKAEEDRKRREAAGERRVLSGVRG